MSEATSNGFTGAYREPISLGCPLGNGYRWYLPSLLRFNAPDELSPFSIGGPNSYAYCGGDPINHVDPTGRSILGALARAWRRVRRTATAAEDGEAIARSDMSLAAAGAADAGGAGQPVLPAPPPYEAVSGHHPSLSHPAEPHTALAPPCYESPEHLQPHTDQNETRLPLLSYAQAVGGPADYQETLASVHHAYSDAMLDLYTKMSTELWTEFQRPIARASERAGILARRSDALDEYREILTDIRQQMASERMLIGNQAVREDLLLRLDNTTTVHDFYVAKLGRQRIGFDN